MLNADREVVGSSRFPDLISRLSGKILLDGSLRPARSRKAFVVVNPATGEAIGEACEADVDDINDAVSSAQLAQISWAKVSARERGKLVTKCGRLLDEHKEELARLVTIETGKALRTESRVEASVLADVFSFFGGLGSELKGETIPFKSGMLTITQREPLGVIAAVLPWNGPLMLLALKIAPALVAGNSVVVKPAEEAPFGVLRACELIAQILPPGLVNVVTGDGPGCGAPLVAHEDVKKVSFTGSVEAGRSIYKAAAQKLIPVTLELGGKSPMIVMADAELQKAVDGAIAGMRFTRQGQSCTASSRIYVHDDLFDEFVARLCDAVNALKIGDPLDESTDVGAIISIQQLERVQSYIQLGEIIPGARAHRCGALPDDPRLAKGLYIQPVIFTGIPDDSKIASDEIFGPVTCIFRFTEYEEAIRRANDTEYGLAATIWTTNLKTALNASQRLEAGLVQVNQNVVVQANMSYGGIKNSGLGKEASLEAMLEHFTHKKTIIFNME